MDDTKPKYINTRDTLIYKKGQNLFALNFAKSSKEDSLILCEGYMDVIALHQAGFTNAVAGLGTALTDEQVRLISHYCSKVYLSYDSDEAGRDALQKALGKLTRTPLAVHPLTYTDAKDPDEVIKKFGPERWKSILAGAMNDIEYKLVGIRDGLDISTDDGRAKYLTKAVPVLAPLSAIEKDIYASRLAEETGVSKDAIMVQVKDAERRIARRASRSDFSGLARDLVKPTVHLKAYRAEETIIATLMKSPDFLKKIETELTPDDFISEGYRHIYAVFAERTGSGQSIELDFISSELSGEEISNLVKLKNGELLVSNTLDEVRDCIKILKEEKKKQNLGNAASLSDEEYLKLFKRGDS